MANCTLILGGGISGLAVARYLETESVVLEAEDRPGGLCRSYTKDGFTYDVGGHILFSKNDVVLNEMKSWLADNLHERRRLNDIWYKDRFVKYPFENGLSVLPNEEIYEILRSYLDRDAGESHNLAEWCYKRFGTGLAESYLIPYNQKVWKRDPAKMSMHWVDRIPSPPLEDILKSALGIDTEGYKFQLHFNYPIEGGYESVVRGVASQLDNIFVGFRATSIRREHGTWKVSNGAETYEGDRLVSTIPIFHLLPCLENVPQSVKDAVDSLVYTTLKVHMIAVNHEGLAQKTATYVPNPEILPHRICYMKGFSEATGPKGCSHIITETTANPGAPLLQAADDVTIEMVIDQVKDICGFDANDVCSTDVRTEEYAYPVYDLEYERKIKIIYTYLDSIGIYFTGRFAAFRYINSDKCVEFARDLAIALNRGAPVERNWVHV